MAPGLVWDASQHLCPGGAFGDCDDQDASVSPDAVELCNGRDDNCDGDPGDDEIDGDGDGLLICAGDCLDNEPAVPGPEEIPGNGLDDDCDGQIDGLVDVDGDGVDASVDCDDTDAAVFPGAEELCNGIDDDCDLEIDDGVEPLPWWPDDDGDGVGAEVLAVYTCTPPEGFVGATGDCADGDASVAPGMDESCNTVDDNCDGQVDEGLDPQTIWQDLDGDGFAAPGAAESFGCPTAVGWSNSLDDCDGSDPTVNPGAVERCDGADQDCDGEIDEGLPVFDWLPDRDGDGVGDASAPATTTCLDLSLVFVSVGGDCDDNDATVLPGATEVCNEVDDNCEGTPDEGLALVDWYVDRDSDGHGSESANPVRTCLDLSATHATSPGDCEDNDPAVFPTATEACNGADDDCDNEIDEGVVVPFWWPDFDGDGQGDAGVPGLATCTDLSATHVHNGDDCDDSRPGVGIGQLEVCNGYDDDCDGGVDEGTSAEIWYRDLDGDQVGDSAVFEASCFDLSATHALAQGDCDDTDPTTHPGAPELCDAVDHNCNGPTDDNVAFVDWYADLDGDGVGDGEPTNDCMAPNPGDVTTDGDCDDSDPQIGPSAVERCNNLDDDCDGVADDGVVPPTWWLDADGDDVGGSTVQQSCEQPEGWVAQGGDCDDLRADVNPSASEVCNAVDDNCNALVDEGFPLAAMRIDDDGDGYGRLGPSTQACVTAAGWSDVGGDCDDDVDTIHPGVLLETCNELDDDCDGTIDDGLAEASWWVDVDGDGYGEGDALLTCLDLSQTHATSGGDCAPDNPDRHPNNPEVCDGLDQDCVRGPDNDLTVRSWWVDLDGDGYGDDGVPADSSCLEVREGYADRAGDCEDGNPAVHSGRAEICNNIDDDCSGQADDGLTFTRWYVDSDGDGHGDASQSVLSCEPLPSTHSLLGDDCDDTRAFIYLGADELCNGLDDDCDGAPDDGIATQEWWLDSDGDGFGSTAGYDDTCVDLSASHATNSTDCADDEASVYPGAPELCDGLDNNCSGIADDGTLVDWWLDDDGDGYGDGDEGPITDCEDLSSQGYASNPDDCDDGNSARRPGLPELCNEIDDDCDGGVDEGLSATWYQDGDLDGYGVAAQTLETCAPPPGWAALAGDCDDADDTVSPGVAEICDAIDQDCDGILDNGLANRITLYRDGDGDTWGDGDPVVACAGAEGWVPRFGDCDDVLDEVFPGAQEQCDGLDNDCNGTVDDTSDTQWWRVDGDGDGVGAGDPVQACAEPVDAGVTWVVTTGPDDVDCDDANPDVFPGAPERCNQLDDNCNNQSDEGLAVATIWPDADNDSWGDETAGPIYTCEVPDGFVTRGRDCDDNEPLTRPDAVEVCNGRQNDCNPNTEPPCPVIDLFRANTWRGPGLLDQTRLPASQTTCDTDTETWLSPWVDSDAPTGTSLERVEGQRLLLQWQTTHVSGVAFPSLGMAGLPPDGALATNVEPTGPLTLVARDTSALNLVEATIPYTQASPSWASLDDTASCHLIRAPQGLFPGQPLAAPRGPSLVRDCGNTVDRLTDHPECATCSAPVPRAGVWSFTDGGDVANSSVQFTEQNANPANDGEYLLRSYPFIMPADAEIWVVGTIGSDGGEGQLRMHYASPTSSTPCDVQGTEVPSTWVYEGPSTHVAWNFGRGQETRPAMLNHVDQSSGFTRIQLELVARVDSGPAAQVDFEGLEMYCCGSSCGTCLDRDGDGHGQWCRGFGADPWDCNETNLLDFPGSLVGNDCADPNWYTDTCVSFGPTP